MAKYCKNCGEYVQQDTQFCPACGKPINKFHGNYNNQQATYAPPVNNQYSNQQVVNRPPVNNQYSNQQATYRPPVNNQYNNQNQQYGYYNRFGELKQNDYTGYFVGGIILAFLLPIVAMLVGIYILTRNDSPKAETRGLIVIGIAVIIFILRVALLMILGNM